MRNFCVPLRRLLPLFLGGFCTLGLGSSGLFADEPVMDFLGKLREKGYFEEAVYYLEQLETGPNTRADFKQTIPFEKALTMIQSASRVREQAKLESTLDAAEQQLDLFLKNFSTHPRASEATELYGSLLIKRSELSMKKSRDAKLPEGQRASFVSDARTQLQKAEQIFQKSREDLKQILGRIDAKTTDPGLKKTLAEARDRYVEIRINLPLIKQLIAETYPDTDPNYNKLLSEASTEFQQIRTDYERTRPGGSLVATVYLGQTMTKLKQYADALPYLKSILELADDPSLRVLKAQALPSAIACWKSTQPPNYDEMLPALEKTVGNIFPNEESNEDWQSLRLEYAKTLREWIAFSATLPKSPELAQLVTVADNRSEQIVRELTKASGPVKREAQELLVSWGLARSASLNTKDGPLNFQTAYDKGKSLYNEYENARVASQALEKQIAAEGDATKKSQLQSQLDAAKQTMSVAPPAALRSFEAAISMANDETPREDIAIIRQYMAVLYFAMERYYHVGVIADYSIKNNPNSAGVKVVASLAMRAWTVLYARNSSGDKSFEAAQMRSAGDVILKYWPDSQEAISAANALAFLSLVDRKIDTAKEYLEKIPPTAPERLKTELQLGVQLYQMYLTQLNALEVDRRNGVVDDAAYDAKKQELLPLREEAFNYLVNGVPKIAANDADVSTVSAALSLAQILINKNEAAKAVEILEKPDGGLLVLARSGNPILADPKLHSNLYRTALRSYIGSLANAQNRDEVVGKAREVMNELSAAAEKTDAANAGDPEKRGAEKKKLLDLYVDLVSDLTLQMASLPSVEQRKAFGQGLVNFLDEIKKSSQDITILVWSADTLVDVGTQFLQDKLVADSKQMFQKADATFGEITKLKNVDPKLLMRAKTKQAFAKRGLGEYETAMKLYGDILLENPSFIPAQIDAAETLQLWGRATKNADLIAAAMSGYDRRVNPKTKKEENVVWGWGKIGQITIRSKDLREIFIQSRYNLAYSRFEYAVLKNSDDQLQRVKKDVQVTYEVDKELGGPIWKSRFDALMKALQKQLKEQPTGLKSVEAAAAAAAKTAPGKK